MAGKENNGRKSRKKSTVSDFYQKVFDESVRLDFDAAADVNGIDDEIALIRIIIKNYMEKHPDDIRLIIQAANALARMVKINYTLKHDQKNMLKEGISNVIKEMLVPLGVSFIDKKL
jgi:hypothetical protein